ncbi:MAG: molybdenum cofactor biosynthesis protein B [Nitrospiria bacterium]
MGWTVGILSVKEKGILPGEDRVTTELKKMIGGAGGMVTVTEVIEADREKIEKQLISWSDMLKTDVILTAGGSGLGKQDCAPDATRAVVDREVPAISDIMRLEVFRKGTKKAVISRAIAGIRGDTLIINLPGSPAPARENLDVIIDTLAHFVDMIRPRVV